MTAGELIAAFEVLAEAPDGVKRLRELVLQLAVRGKLVAQDARGESTHALLRRLDAARRGLTDSLRTRPAKDLPPLSTTDEPYAIPTHWRWCRLQELGVVVSGATPTSHDPSNFCEQGGYPWVTPADMRAYADGKWISRGSRNLTDQGFASCSAQLMPKGTGRCDRERESRRRWTRRQTGYRA